jgi:hypothetical protein
MGGWMRRDSKVRLPGTSLVHLDTRMLNKQTGISVGTFVSNLSRDVVMFSFQIFTVLVAWKYSTLDIYFL